jgi:hypothetical protein
MSSLHWPIVKSLTVFYYLHLLSHGQPDAMVQFGLPIIYGKELTTQFPELGKLKKILGCNSLMKNSSALSIRALLWQSLTVKNTCDSDSGYQSLVRLG